MEVTTNNPQEEDEKDSTKDRPFDDNSSWRKPPNISPTISDPFSILSLLECLLHFAPRKSLLQANAEELKYEVNASARTSV